MQDRAKFLGIGSMVKTLFWVIVARMMMMNERRERA